MDKDMNPNSAKDKMDYYNRAINLLEHEVSFNWQRLTCFLTTNSILFAAWAIMFAEIDKPPRILLVGMSLLGFLLSVVWTFASIRGNRFHFFWIQKVREFEENESNHIPDEHKLFLPLRELTRDGKVEVGVETIELKWLAKLRVGDFFTFLSTAFVVVYLLLTIYSFYIPERPPFFRDP